MIFVVTCYYLIIHPLKQTDKSYCETEPSSHFNGLSLFLASSRPAYRAAQAMGLASGDRADIALWLTNGRDPSLVEALGIAHPIFHHTPSNSRPKEFLFL